jgi:uncharacterized Zn-finger protein
MQNKKQISPLLEGIKPKDSLDSSVKPSNDKSKVVSMPTKMGLNLPEPKLTDFKAEKNILEIESNLVTEPTKFQCQWCNKKFTTKNNLKTHIETAKYCLKKRELKEKGDADEVIQCDFCLTKFSAKSSLLRHSSACKDKISQQVKILHDSEIKKLTEEFNVVIKKLESNIEELNKSVASLKSTLEERDITIEESEEYIKELEIRVAKEEGIIEVYKQAKPQQNNITTNYVKNNKIKNVLTTTIEP